MQNKDIAEYIGIAYTQCNCWQLVARVQAEMYGRAMPLFDHVCCWDPVNVAKAIKTALPVPNWHRVNTPKNGDIILMSRGRVATHAGIFHNAHILHTTAVLNACLTPVEVLPKIGYRVAGIFTYES